MIRSAPIRSACRRIFQPFAQPLGPARRPGLGGALAIVTLLCAASAAQAQLPIEIIRAFSMSEPVSAGRDTADVQRDLLWIGLYRGAIDGWMGAATEQALRDFQNSLGLMPDGTLTPDAREALARRASQTRAGMDLQRETSDWTGIQMGVPRGYVGEARVIGEDNLGITYEGRAAVPFQIMQMRFPAMGGMPSPREMARIFTDGEKDSEILASGRAEGVTYVQVRVGDMLAYSIVAQQQGEVRGVTVSMSAAEATALLPVMAEVFATTDLFAGDGVPFDDVERRIRDGRHPGMEDRPDWFKSMIASGSGALVSTEGHVLTNHHVIGGCTRVTVNGQPAKLLGSDIRVDLALLHVPRLSGREPISFRADGPKLGEQVLVIGYPVFSITQAMNVTDGVLSSTVGFEGSRLSLQITAPVQPGNSGGPVLDRAGRQIAVVASKAGRGLREESGVENMAWVVRGDVVRDFLNRYAIRFRESQGPAPALAGEDIVAQHRDKVLRVECH